MLGECKALINFEADKVPYARLGVPRFLRIVPAESHLLATVVEISGRPRHHSVRTVRTTAVP